MKLEEFVAESASQHKKIADVRKAVTSGLAGFCDYIYGVESDIENGYRVEKDPRRRMSTETRHRCDLALSLLETYERLEGQLDFFERVLLNRIIPLEEGDQTRSEYLVNDLPDDAIIETAFGLATVRLTYPVGEHNPEGVRIKIEMLGEHVYSTDGRVVEFDLLRYQLVRVVNNQQ